MAENLNNKSTSPKVHKIYKQKFRTFWINTFGDWLIPCPDDPDRPFCKVCCRKFEGGISHIRRHASTPSHKKKYSKSHIVPQDSNGTNPLNKQTSLKNVTANCNRLKKVKKSTSKNSSIEISGHVNEVQPENISNSFMETRSEDSQPLQIACVSMPHLVTQPNQVCDGDGHHQSDTTATISLNPTIHHSSFLEPSISLPSVETSHVNAEFNNQLSSNGHHLKPLHVHRNGEVSTDAQSKFTDHSEIFDSGITTPTKLQNETYLMEVNDVDSSCEVTVGGNHSTCQDLTNLESDHHARHIMVTIEGQDPMYIHSSVNPDPHVGYSRETDSYNSALHNDSTEDPSVSKKRKKRKEKLKKRCKSKNGSGQDGHEEDRDRISVKENLDGSKSGTDEDATDCKKNNKWYRQKYKKNWETNEEFCGWLSPSPSDPSMAFCIACSKGLSGGLTHLKRHAETPYHKKRMVETQKKRELICAKNIELRLSNFAHEFGLSDRAACTLPELLKNIFPDNNLCKLLSDDRILAMLLVHRESVGATKKHQEKPRDCNIIESRKKACTNYQLNTSDNVGGGSVMPHTHANHYDSVEPLPCEIITVGEHRVSQEFSVSCSPSTTTVPATTAPHTISSLNLSVGVPVDPGLQPLGRCSADQEIDRYSRGDLIVHHLDTNDDFKAHTDSTPYLVSSCATLSGPARDRWQGRVALVTGASDSIGVAVCRALVELGMRVVGVASSPHPIQALVEELSGERGSLTALQCDLSKDEEVERVFAEVLRSHGAVHCCVNNAGFSANNSLLDGSPSEWRAMLDVNVVGLCLLTKLCVNSMMEKGIDDGYVIHISSISGHRIVPSTRFHFYAATKFAVRALTEGLRQELRAAKSHIRVSSISPGLVETEFALNMTSDAAAVAKIYSALECLKSEDVVASVLHMLCAPPHVEINDVVMRPTEQLL